MNTANLEDFRQSRMLCFELYSRGFYLPLCVKTAFDGFD